MERLFARCLVAGAAVCLLPACDYFDLDPDYELTIVNAGTSPVAVDIKFTAEASWDGDFREQHFILEAGERREIDLADTWVEVLVIRLPDGAVLFREELGWRDFNDDKASVTVVP